ncbi:MAG: hypothetical protein R2692_02365 [Microbacterium sp.]
MMFITGAFANTAAVERARVGLRRSSEIAVPAVSSHGSLSADAKGIADLSPGEVVGARVADGNLDDFGDRGLECTKVSSRASALRYWGRLGASGSPGRG